MGRFDICLVPKSSIKTSTVESGPISDEVWPPAMSMQEILPKNQIDLEQNQACALLSQKIT